jgi:hypothetical protein
MIYEQPTLLSRHTSGSKLHTIDTTIDEHSAWPIQ